MCVVLIRVLFVCRGCRRFEKGVEGFFKVRVAVGIGVDRG